ncbi:hypothetical protein Q5P01_021560 [Channa striata]|uniref:Uncharacterized protein n=1 Tax=Channa striata TaxID=64152 RepID=A0AA88LUH7_CHASR|nr:hypothetical protein Q5P01_021560 [Channa striata]
MSSRRYGFTSSYLPFVLKYLAIAGICGFSTGFPRTEQAHKVIAAQSAHPRKHRTGTIAPHCGVNQHEPRARQKHFDLKRCSICEERQ